MAGPSRRELLRNLAGAGSAAALLPVRGAMADTR